MSRTQEGGRDHRDAVGAPVGLPTGRHDDGVEQAITESITQPAKVSAIVAANHSSELDLDRQDPLIGAFRETIYRRTTIQLLTLLRYVLSVLPIRQSTTRRRIATAFWPPKPKPSTATVSTRVLRAVSGT